MRAIAWFGLALLLAGLVMLAKPMLSYTDKDTVIDAGPLKVQTENEKHVPISPLAGGAAVAAGVALLAMGRRH